MVTFIIGPYVYIHVAAVVNYDRLSVMPKMHFYRSHFLFSTAYFFHRRKVKFAPQPKIPKKH